MSEESNVEKPILWVVIDTQLDNTWAFMGDDTDEEYGWENKNHAIERILDFHSNWIEEDMIAQKECGEKITTQEDLMEEMVASEFPEFAGHMVVKKGEEHNV